MTTWTVTYEIEVDASGPLEAAQEVYAIMLDPTSLPPVLDCLDHDTAKWYRVDLADDQDAGREL